MTCDVLIVGAGPVGAAAARVLAERGLHCLLLEKRHHIAGNCYDEKDEHGVLVHRYGPHSFRTDSKPLIDFLSSYTEWIPGDYGVRSLVRGTLFPFPINIETLEKYFGRQLNEELAEKLLDDKRLALAEPVKNSEEWLLSRIGRELYEDFYLGYTLKQWGLPPRELAPSVCGRVPVRLDRESSYINEKYKQMPRRGYTQMFRRMLEHPKIEVKLGVDDLSYREAYDYRYAMLYTGPIDEYFHCRFGPLPWRSLEFEFKNYNQEFVQPCLQINYPGLDVSYTRSVEIKHLTRQKLPSTTVSYEYPLSKGEPYYPIPKPESEALYERYRGLAEDETRNRRVYFAGRLAEYAYINADEALLRGLSAAEDILRLCVATS